MASNLTSAPTLQPPDRGQLELVDRFRWKANATFVLAAALVLMLALREAFVTAPTTLTDAVPVLGLLLAALGLWGWYRAQRRLLQIDMLLSESRWLARNAEPIEDAGSSERS